MWNPFSKSFIGKPAQDVTGAEWFNLVTLPDTAKQYIEQDNTLSLKEMRGYVILLHFWSSSCITCLKMLPELRALWDANRDKNFFAIGIHTPDFSYEGNTDQVQQSIIKFGLSYPVLNDADLTMWDRYRCEEKPRLFLIDQHGKVRIDQSGKDALSGVDTAITELLAAESR